MPMLEGVDDEVTVVMTVFLMLMGLVVTWLFASFQQETQQQNNDPSSPTQPGQERNETDQVVVDDPDENRNSDQETEPRVDEPEPDNDSPVNEEAEIPEPADGHIRVRIKYLDDRVRCVLAPANTPIDEFKRAHFGRELAQELLVRLIHNGRELQAHETLEQYNIGDLSTIHCLVVPRNRNQGQNDAEGELADLDLSNLMLPMFTLILALIWYCRILYRNFFNALSTLALVGITLLYVFTLVMTWRNGELPAPERVVQIGVRPRPHHD